MKRTLAQNKQLHGLLNRLGIDSEQKAELVALHTGNRTTSSAAMSYRECQALISALRDSERDLTRKDAQERDTKRKRVISHLKEAGYTLPDGRADMPAIYAWVREQKHKKEFNAHTSQELSTLIFAASRVRDHFLTKQ